MVRPRKSISGIDGNAEVESLRNTVERSALLHYLQRIEHVNGEIALLAEDRRTIYLELKRAGYDPATVRELIKRRKLTEEQREAADALMDQYRSALGDFASTPLGEAALPAADVRDLTPGRWLPPITDAGT